MAFAKRQEGIGGMRSTSGGDHAVRRALAPQTELSILRIHELIEPQRPLWAPNELRHLTSTVAAELTVPLLRIVWFVPEQRWWVRLALTGGVELWLLSWLPGQGIGPHDHGGACGAFAVLLGELTEDYRYPGGSSRCALRQVGAAVGFGSSRAHRMRNLGMRGAVSVHAYSPPLLPIREYSSLADEVAHETRSPIRKSA
jgi:Cysteine dioxygenase type I